ncbi:HpcH/HpaI aldolase family protein [Bacilliculturomica massiliensis]|uniref:HpcH/HpaI aldolase family protein n=1 Tax=Bacilliculturomica massiliensis TaxID=1917867 RepID=UPI00102FEB7B|nr:aldolase/citrate lyase family protein [Bacilliculturomica massiliensis]
MKKNEVKERLMRGETVLGAFQGYDAPEITEILGYAGFDFVVLDAEHGGLYPGLLEGQIRAAECGDTAAFVRVPSFQRQDILKALDRGASGILVPMVNTRADAEQVISHALYTPKGNRGLTFSSRAAHYNVRVDQELHLRSSNDELLIMVQIETMEAVENLDEILAVEDVDLVFIGPSDLSQSMGMPGQTGNPEVQKTIRLIIEKAHKAGKKTGIFTSTVEATKKWMDEGVQLILAGSQGIIAKALSNYVDDVRESVKRGK